MSTKLIRSKEGIDDRLNDLITSPHVEPATVANATTYWRCEDCGRESIRRHDLDRPAFHAEECGGRSIRDE